MHEGGVRCLGVRMATVATRLREGSGIVCEQASGGSEPVQTVYMLFPAYLARSCSLPAPCSSIRARGACLGFRV